MMRPFVLPLLLAALAPLPAMAGSGVPSGSPGGDIADTTHMQPLHDGDHWVYSHLWELGGTVRRPARTDVWVWHDPRAGLMVARRELDTQDPPVRWSIAEDWSRKAKGETVERPLAFPLWPGKSWDVAHWQPDPENMGYEREGVHQHYSVAGWEDISVPAGKFHAVKIEVSGQWTATPPSGSVGLGPRDGLPLPKNLWQAPTPLHGQVLRTLWYVPEVKRWVRQIEYYYDANGALLERHEGELESYKVSW